MSSFIPKQDKTPKVGVTLKLREDASTELKSYARYLESDVSYVVEQLVLKATRSDKEYIEWLSYQRIKPEAVKPKGQVA